MLHSHFALTGHCNPGFTSGKFSLSKTERTGYTLTLHSLATATWHEGLPQTTRKAVCDGILDEGHIEAIYGVNCDIANLSPWLTTRQAQTELTAEVLGKQLHSHFALTGHCNRGKIRKLRNLAEPYSKLHSHFVLDSHCNYAQFYLAKIFPK